MAKSIVVKFALLAFVLAGQSSAQSTTGKIVAVCIEHVGTRGFAETSLFGQPVILSSSKPALAKCHQDFVTRMGEDDEHTFDLVISSILVRSLVTEVARRPSLSSVENQPLGTYLFVAITPKDSTARILDKDQTVIVLRSLMRKCKRGLAFRFLQDYAQWLDNFQPFPSLQNRDHGTP